MKKNEKELSRDEIKKATIRNTIILIEKILFLVVIVFVVGKYFFEFYRVDNNSMQPYVNDGDLALVYKKNKSYSIGDVVIFKLNNKKYALRIVAKEGQTISISDTGVLLIDGWPEVNESTYKTYEAENSHISYPYIVERGKVFVLSDNRYQDEDSRFFGAVDVKTIIGKVVGVVRTRSI